MKKLYSDHLHKTLESIGRFGLKDDFAERPRPMAQRVKQGPSKWLEIHDDTNAYGKDFDYRVMDGDVFMPLCPAACEWGYYVFPEGLDRYSDLDGNIGWRITNGLEVVLDAASRDGLLDEEEYRCNMENDELARQWE